MTPFQRPRKIISVTTIPVENTRQTQCDFITTALCDDGSVWQTFGQSSTWVELPPIPQPQTFTERMASSVLSGLIPPERT